MKNTLFVIAATAIALSSAPTFAKGCMKGAAVGAIGGHMVGKGHAVAGAAAGCAVGHHHAAKKAKAR